jgi:hypothetical protein
MKRTFLSALAIGAALLSSGAALAKQYVDYTPQKALWEINAIEVDPNHIDDYLTGLRRTEGSAFAVMKKHGIIDDYRILTRVGYSKGTPNVLIELHYTSADMMEPNQARDEMIEKEMLATLSEADGKAAVANFEKYRQFVDDAMWGEVKLAK